MLRLYFNLPPGADSIAIPASGGYAQQKWIGDVQQDLTSIGGEAGQAAASGFLNRPH
jgi:hypothetical protein